VALIATIATRPAKAPSAAQPQPPALKLERQLQLPAPSAK
jgi:hypothetical protein